MATLEICKDIFQYTNCDAYCVGCENEPNKQCLVWERNVNDRFPIYMLYRLGSCDFISSSDVVWSKYNHNLHKWEEIYRGTIGGYYGFVYQYLNWIWDMALYKVEYKGLSTTFKSCPHVPTAIDIYIDGIPYPGSTVKFYGKLYEQSIYFDFSVQNQKILIGYMSNGVFNKLAEGYTDKNGYYSIPCTVNLSAGTYDFKVVFDGEMIAGTYDNTSLWYTLDPSEAKITLTVLNVYGCGIGIYDESVPRYKAGTLIIDGIQYNVAEDRYLIVDLVKGVHIFDLIMPSGYKWVRWDIYDWNTGQKVSESTARPLSLNVDFGDKLWGYYIRAIISPVSIPSPTPTPTPTPTPFPWWLLIPAIGTIYLLSKKR